MTIYLSFFLQEFLKESNINIYICLQKKIEKNCEKFVIHFVNACILSCKASFDVLVYHTSSIWFFFFLISELHSLMKIENGSIF